MKILQAASKGVACNIFIYNSSMIQKPPLFFLLLGMMLLASCNLPAETAAPPIASPAPSTATQTPPEPATPTQTFTPAPTFTPTPYPMYYTEDFNSDLGAWDTLQTGGANSPAIKIENSMLRIDMSSPNTWYYVLGKAHEYSRVVISAKVDGAPAGSIGLVCFYEPSLGWYEFNVASDGSYSVLLGQWLSEDVAQYTPLATDTTGYLQPGSLNYEISMACDTNTLQLYINGSLFRKLDVTSYGLFMGRVGVSTASFDEVPMTVIIDWVNVTEK